MIKEELEKEIADWWRIKFCVELKDDICQMLIIDEVVELCNKIAEPREKRIKELEQENAELKRRVENQKSFLERIKAKFELGEIDRKEIEGYLEGEQLTKAKEIIKDLLNILPKENIEGIYEVTEYAEQFLRDCDIDNAIQQANEGLNFDKIADEMEQDLKDSEELK